MSDPTRQPPDPASSAHGKPTPLLIVLGVLALVLGLSAGFYMSLIGVRP